MRSDEFARMRALQDSHWWFAGRRLLLRSLVARLGLCDSLILDAGCGTGFARDELSRAGAVVGLDSSREALRAWGDATARLCCLASVERLPFARGVFDLVVALDVLEHLEDDSIALSEMERVCKPGGYAFVTVPACPRLWSSHDEVLGHRRRYTMGDIVSKIRDAGFSVQKASHIVTGPFVPAALLRMARRRRAPLSSDLAPVPEPLNSLLILWMRLEVALAWRTGLPFGLTVFVLARKGVADSVGGSEQ